MPLCAGQAIEGRYHVVAECGLHKEERDVLEGKIWEVNGGMKSYDALDSRRKRWLCNEIDGGHGRRNRTGIRYVKGFV